MLEIITKVLLGTIFIVSSIFLILVNKNKIEMTKKQKLVLSRILASSFIVFILDFFDADSFNKINDYINYPVGRWIRLAFYFIAYFVIGQDILKKAVKGIQNKQVFDENFLMALATIGAFSLAIYKNSEYLEAIAVMLFYQIGELFQAYAVGKSRKSISNLMDIRPDYANIEINGKIEQVSPDEVGKGNIIIVRPGEKVPIDGIVIDGASSLDTKAITGESLPQNISLNDEIISGYLGIMK